MDTLKQIILDSKKSSGSFVINDDEVSKIRIKTELIEFKCKNGHFQKKPFYRFIQNLQKNNNSFYCHSCAILNHKVKCFSLKEKKSFSCIPAIFSKDNVIEACSDGELWKTIDHPFNNYSVSNFGNVRNNLTGKFLKLENIGGYLRAVLCGKIDSEIKRSKSYVHRLVALAFLEKPENDDECTVDHINHIRSDNRVENLRWVSSAFNSQTREKETKPRDIYFPPELLSNPNIQWKPLQRDHLDILVSNTGLIKTYKTITNGTLDKKGYRRFAGCSVHRLVAETFLECPKNIDEFIVNHKNGNKEDNNIENLEWISHSQNSLHASKNGFLDGRKRKILQFDMDGKFLKEFPSQADAARELKISQDAIYMCVSKSTLSSGGFIWRYSDECSGEQEIVPVLKLTREIHLKNANTHEVENTFESIADAARTLKCSQHKIKLLADSKKILIDNYYLCFSEPENGKLFSEKNKARGVKRLHPDKTTVFAEFKSIIRATMESHLGEATVKKCCQEGKSDREGYFWMYI